MRIICMTNPLSKEREVSQLLDPTNNGVFDKSTRREKILA